MGVGQSEDGVAVGQPEDAAQAQGSSVGDAVRALFAKYGIGPGGVRFQWIKGKLIGRGSFGHVHVAINAGTGEVIAVKQIRVARRVRAAEAEDARQRAQQLAAAQMMYTEVAVLRDLDHENIVQLLGFEVAGGVMSMFLEYVAGGTVQSLVQQHGPLHEPTVHSFVAQIARGLAYLHACAIVHRDIKGANILVDETGTCKISDFGISRKADRERLVEEVRAIPADPAKSVTPADPAKPAKPAPSRMLGTVPFMAPEVVRSSEYSAAADIWAFGCVVVQMWSGRQPWDDLQEPQVFFKLGRGEAPSIPDDLTDAGLDFCKKCFATDPRRRWSANHLAGLPFAHVSPTYEYPYRADFSA
ncbi:Pkinase-domain-containing protein [Coemansia reversa NRRL 1564]|uniref:Pkinase-domain-containing protein n=1 Tax=Coemansia reversa (strain ATCC 12441 / NRRL 1564) TaxID=763665 RepID=A0A2G5B532_COERN|nr:Pkinase-domain-containing protein [Coemansia reversa NRRL 1564]|eukprot:PIA14115.1 Pkinase-domain-containing protein [Coemansia reversa NRRL 1564]